MSYIIRSIEITDEPFLWEMLYQALYVPPEADPLPRDVIFQPELAKYVQNWVLHEDTGLIAVLEESQKLVGAAWLRVFKSSNPGYGYINDSTPELSIAVLPKYRGQGIGTKLLTKLFSQVRNRYSAVSLSVSSDNPAFRLYLRFGFEIISQYDNSLTMKKDL
ncbi:GCN5-related N-acetyltransferase [Hyella patelloides LEGE 07179]|uniref:GCN5-related N-acetyltransferase n=1 Tax=Hyella patelloides LEGE 07179 TaxID=945734 RepID=A0A563VPV6_9CYAN|nr:GNAT family N-acetyltransferase [Hyella patelloides]VEP13502.1 GCN5-related N-acetyltransferase [Hyella patelloides LEGE 07179]